MNLNQDKVQKLDLKNAELSDALSVDDARQGQIQAAYVKAARDNENLLKANVELRGYENRAKGYEVIMGVIRAYEDGLPIHGDMVFNMLRDSGVVSPGLSYENNLKNFERLFEDVDFGSCKKSKNLKKIVDEAVEKIRAKISPRLKVLETAAVLDKELLYDTALELGKKNKWGKYGK